MPLINDWDGDQEQQVDLGAVGRRYRAVLAARPGGQLLAALVVAVVDVPVLAAEVRRLRTRLATLRLRYANLVAAGRATLGAAADGEGDPLACLRDELPPLPPGHPGHQWPASGRGWCR
jgi:hypothetical protein